MDQFKSDYDKIKRLFSQVNQDINKKNNLKSQSKSTARIDQEINSQFKDCQNELEEVGKSLQKMKQDLQGFGITEREYERRFNLVDELKNQLQELKRRFELTKQIDNFNPNREFQKSNQNEFKDRYADDQVSNKQVYEVQQDMKKKQDEDLDQLNEVLGQIKTGGKIIGKELDEQNDMLEDLEKGVEKGTKDMNKIRGKMVMLLEEVSNWKLVIIIALELALLFVFLFALS